MKSPLPQFTDVTLRDGLQMESRAIATLDKVVLFQTLLACPYDKLEITSFVSPKWVSQFADSEEFCKLVFANPWPAGAPAPMAFVPNERGLERLFKFPIEWASCFVSVSETFNQKNVNASISETLQVIERLIRRAKPEKRKVRVYLSTAFGCPYEGEVTVDAVKNLFHKIACLGPDEIALGDTIGVASPSHIRKLLLSLKDLFPIEKIALHFHNTYGLAVACALTGWEEGVLQFDGSTGGIGGCPYAKGATGNVPLESLLYAFFRENVLLEFPKNKITPVLTCLESQLGLSVRSPLYDILKKGGEFYAVK